MKRIITESQLRKIVRNVLEEALRLRSYDELSVTDDIENVFPSILELTEKNEDIYDKIDEVTHWSIKYAIQYDYDKGEKGTYDTPPISPGVEFIRAYPLSVSLKQLSSITGLDVEQLNYELNEAGETYVNKHEEEIINNNAY